MASMPGVVTKTLTFIQMDAAWTANPAAFLNDYANKEFDNLLASAPVKQATKQHVSADWVPSSDDWLGPHAKQVIRRGLYWAMRVALYENAGTEDEKPRKQALPICSAWVCSGAPGKQKKKPGGKKDVPRFEVVSLESPHQVTLLILTPPPSTNPHGDQLLQPVWATRLLDPYGPEAGELELEQWPADEPVTVTVRPYDYTEV
ncbi:MAG: hypothetical protein ABFS41_09995 [Myxococcota bacterium]